MLFIRHLIASYHAPVASYFRLVQYSRFIQAMSTKQEKVGIASFLFGNCGNWHQQGVDQGELLGRLEGI